MGLFGKKKEAAAPPPPPPPPPMQGEQRYRGAITSSVPAGWLVKESITLLSGDGQANVIASSEPLDPTVDAKRYAEAQGELLRKEFPGYQETGFAQMGVFGGLAGYSRTFSWTPPDGAPVSQIQLYWAQGGRGYTATATTPSQHFPRLAPTLRGVLDSLRLGDATPVPEPGPVAVDPETTRDRVQRMLAEILGTVEVNQAGLMSFPYESTRVFVEVQPFNETSVVSVYAIAVLDAPITPQLYEYVAKKTDQWLFGHLGLQEAPSGAAVIFRRSLLADFLDIHQLSHLLGVVATTANEIDEEIVQGFGGKRFRDAMAQQAAGAPTTQPGGPTDGGDQADSDETPGYL